MSTDRSPAEEFNGRVDAIVRRHGVKRGAAIPILQDVQKEFGYIPKFVLHKIADLTGIDASDLYSIVTFYSQFRLEPAGEMLIHVCHGTACHLAGAEAVTDNLRRAAHIEEGNTSPDGRFTVEKVACVGCCSLAPVMTIDGKVFGRLTPEKAASLIESEYARKTGGPGKEKEHNGGDQRGRKTR